MIVEWSDGFKTGCENTDEGHKKLFDIINELFDCYKLDWNAEGTRCVIEKLFEYAVTHFPHEERSMLLHHYPEIVAHLEQHSNFKTMIRGLLCDLDEGEMPDYYDVFLFLVEWISAHIGKFDKEYFSYLKSEGISIAA